MSEATEQMRLSESKGTIKECTTAHWEKKRGPQTHCPSPWWGLCRRLQVSAWEHRLCTQMLIENVAFTAVTMQMGLFGISGVRERSETKLSLLQ